MQIFYHFSTVTSQLYCNEWCDIERRRFTDTNCTSVTAGKNWIWSFILAKYLCIWKYTNVKITFKYKNTISLFTTSVNKNISPHPLWQKRNLLADTQHLQTIVSESNQPETHTTLPGAHTIHQNPQPTTSIRSAYLYFFTNILRTILRTIPH